MLVAYDELIACRQQQPFPDGGVCRLTACQHILEPVEMLESRQRRLLRHAEFAHARRDALTGLTIDHKGHCACPQTRLQGDSGAL